MARTVIDIEDDVLEKAQKMTGINKKVDIVNYALKKLVEQKEIEEILKLKGKIEWTGDLEEMRKGRDDTR
jgi:Arc/MetJ family transcription regulator